MTHPNNNEWVLLVDDDSTHAIVETVVDINFPSSSESGYTSEDALADEILGGDVDCEKATNNHSLQSLQSLQSHTIKSNASHTHNYLSPNLVMALLIANVLVMMAYVCLRGRFRLPHA
jgi:hypothetical protein